MIDANELRRLVDAEKAGEVWSGWDLSAYLHNHVSEILAAIQDRERLDYLEQNPDVYFFRQGKDDVRLLTTDHDFMQDPEFVQAGSLRSAIDAAIRMAEE